MNDPKQGPTDTDNVPINKDSQLIIRPCTQKEFSTAYLYKIKSDTSIARTIKNYCDKCNTISIMLSLFPIFKWLPQYNCKANLMYDIVTGLTVAVMHIPQGMAYASLGGVNPIVGIYMAVFPVIIYSFMGTSRHISLGSFSVVCLMAAESVLTLSASDGGQPKYSPIQVASVISLIVGLLQLLLGLCRVGSISMFMSPPLVDGFTTGTAVLVFVSQLEHVIGVKLPNHFGPYNIIYTLKDFVTMIPKTNYLALIISLSVILFLLIYTDVIKPKLNCNYALPIELIVIVLATVMSYTFELKDKHKIKIVGSIPAGLPSPHIPPIELAPKVLVNCMVIAIVSFTINISMATIFARKDNYKLDPNQELMATGCSNVVGGFFSCLPISASLSRSMIQYGSGGKTQLVGLFSCLFLLSVLFYLGQFLEPLPYCVLAGIIIKSLKVMLLQVRDLPGLWKQSVTDGVIWLSTFLAVVLIDIEVGLCVALTLSMLSIILMNQKTHVCLLGHVPNTDIYLEIDRYLAAKPIAGFIVIQIHGGLNFANIGFTKDKIEHFLNNAPTANISLQRLTLVIDLSAVSFIDPFTLRSLHTLFSDLEKHQIRVCLANCNNFIYQQMTQCDFFSDLPEQSVFPTIHDAVVYYKDIAQND